MITLSPATSPSLSGWYQFTWTLLPHLLAFPYDVHYTYQLDHSFLIIVCSLLMLQQDSNTNHHKHVYVYHPQLAGRRIFHCNFCKAIAPSLAVNSDVETQPTLTASQLCFEASYHNHCYRHHLMWRSMLSNNLSLVRFHCSNIWNNKWNKYLESILNRHKLKSEYGVHTSHSGSYRKLDEELKMTEFMLLICW